MSELFDLIDEAGRVVGRATREECHRNPSLVHRAVHVLVFGSRGDLYLQKRAPTKDVQPGRWDTSVGGHLALGRGLRAGGVPRAERGARDPRRRPRRAPVPRTASAARSRPRRSLLQAGLRRADPTGPGRDQRRALLDPGRDPRPARQRHLHPELRRGARPIPGARDLSPRDPGWIGRGPPRPDTPRPREQPTAQRPTAPIASARRPRRASSRASAPGRGPRPACRSSTPGTACSRWSRDTGAAPRSRRPPRRRRGGGCRRAR